MSIIDVLQSLKLDEDAYVSLLGDMLSHTKQLQNKPPELVPQESLIGDLIEARVKPYVEAGKLGLERISYAEGRNNVILTYKGTTDATVSFVGAHMDVVPADPSAWERDPFTMVREGDKLYGRGSTDCLGHVALLTEMFVALAESGVELKTTVIAVCIASEENSEIPGVGVDGLAEHGELERCKKGPVIWLDSADVHPCIGTGTCAVWKVTAHGHKGHSGLPQNSMNALQLAYDAAAHLGDRFHADFPAHAEEARYGYKVASSWKPTMWDMPPGASNQIPGEASISGDIRATPFYDPKDIEAKVTQYAEELNADLSVLPTRGPAMKYTCGDKKASITLEWVGEVYPGIACDLDSAGFKALRDATTEIVGECKPSAITGSLPLVGDLQAQGLDIQIVGYGHSEVYHGENEYCTISGMSNGYQILMRFIAKLNA